VNQLRQLMLEELHRRNFADTPFLRPRVENLINSNDSMSGLVLSTNDHAKQMGKNLPTFITNQSASFSLGLA
jgi:hypothetical protein